MARAKSKLPVIISRWFENGHNYAYNEKVDAELLDDVVSKLRSITALTARQRIECSLSTNWCLIGIREKDEATLDPKAADRPTHIIRLAVCSANIQETQKQEIWDQLREAILPNMPGMTSELNVSLTESPSIPQIPLPSVIFRRFPLCILMLRLPKPLPSQKEVGDLEWQWYHGVEVQPNMVGYAAANARIVYPNGHIVQLAANRPIKELQIYRDPDTEVEYDPVIQLHRGFIVLSGNEHLIEGSQSFPVAFTRTYLWHWRHLQWRLHHAQWTRLNTTDLNNVEERTSSPLESREA